MLFEPKRPNQQRCKPGCRRARASVKTEDERLVARERSFESGRLGAANELRVGADLLLKGWYVAMPVSSNCPFDLLAWKDGAAIRVQVKTGHMWKGRLVFACPSPGAYDMLAVVLQDGRIVYDPKATTTDTEWEEPPAAGIEP